MTAGECSLARRTGRLLHHVTTSRDDRRHRLARMVESMADGILLTDLDSDEVTINPAATVDAGATQAVCANAPQA